MWQKMYLAGEKCLRPEPRRNGSQPAQGVDMIPRMDDYQKALAEEIRGAMNARTPRITAKHMQEVLGIVSTTWANYFVQYERDVPMSVVAGVAEELGMKMSELLARAEKRAQEKPATLSEHVASQLTPQAQEGIRKGRKIVADGKPKKRRSQ
jgi:hypothetical protein